MYFSNFYNIIFVLVLLDGSFALKKPLEQLSEDGIKEEKARSLINDLQVSASGLDEDSLKSMLESRSVKIKSKKSKTKASNGSETTSGESSGDILEIILKSESVQALLKPDNFGLILNSKAFKNLLNPKALEHFLDSKVGKQIISSETLGKILNSDVITSKFTPEFVEQLLESVMGVSGAGDRPEFMQAILNSKIWKSLPKLGSLKLLVCSDILAGKDASGAAIIQSGSPKPAVKPDVYNSYLQKQGYDENYLAKYKNPYEYKSTSDEDDSSSDDPYKLTSLDGDDTIDTSDLYQYKPPKKYNPLASSQISSKPFSSYQSSFGGSGLNSKPKYSSPYGYSYNDPASAISSGILGLYNSPSYSSYPSDSEGPKTNYTLQLLDMFLPKVPGSLSSDWLKKKPATPSVDASAEKIDTEQYSSLDTESDEFSASSPALDSLSSTFLTDTANAESTSKEKSDDETPVAITSAPVKIETPEPTEAPSNAWTTRKKPAKIDPVAVETTEPTVTAPAPSDDSPTETAESSEEEAADATKAEAVTPLKPSSASDSKTKSSDSSKAKAPEDEAESGESKKEDSETGPAGSWIWKSNKKKQEQDKLNKKKEEEETSNENNEEPDKSNKKKEKQDKLNKNKEEEETSNENKEESDKLNEKKQNKSEEEEEDKKRSTNRIRRKGGKFSRIRRHSD